MYGTKWKQRYFTKVGDDYFPLSAQWDVTHRVWRPYMVQPNTDGWVRAARSAGRSARIQRRPAGCIGFSPDGTQLVVNGDTQSLHLWDLRTSFMQKVMTLSVSIAIMTEPGRPRTPYLLQIVCK